MSDKCPDCPAPSADMDGFIVSGPGGAPRSEGSGVSSSEGPFAKEAPQTGQLQIRGEVSSSSPLPETGAVGWAYLVTEAGMYGGLPAAAGDVVWISGVNPLRWDVFQSGADATIASLAVSFDCRNFELSVSLAAEGGAVMERTADLSCIPHVFATVAETEALFD